MWICDGPLADPRTLTRSKHRCYIYYPSGLKEYVNPLSCINLTQDCRAVIWSSTCIQVIFLSEFVRVVFMRHTNWRLLENNCDTGVQRSKCLWPHSRESNISDHWEKVYQVYQNGSTRALVLKQTSLVAWLRTRSEFPPELCALVEGKPSAHVAGQRSLTCLGANEN